jgi:hypothetical protein
MCVPPNASRLVREGRNRHYDLAQWPIAKIEPFTQSEQVSIGYPDFFILALMQFRNSENLDLAWARGTVDKLCLSSIAAVCSRGKIKLCAIAAVHA